MIISKMESEGLLSTNDKVSEYIPDYTEGDRISLRHLLTMTSGIYNYFDDFIYDYHDFVKYEHVYSDRLFGKYSSWDLIEFFKCKPLSFNPGTKYEYSNSSYIILGYIIEKLSEMSLGDYLEKNILSELGLKSTSYDKNNYTSLITSSISSSVTSAIPTISAEDRLDTELLSKDTNPRLLSKGYREVLPELIEVPFFSDTVAHAAGGMWSNITDLNKWIDYQLENELFRENLQKHKKSCINIPSTKMSYYNGWIVDMTYDGFRADHCGMVPGYISYVYINQKFGQRLIVLSNNESYYKDFPGFYGGILKT